MEHVGYIWSQLVPSVISQSSTVSPQEAFLPVDLRMLCSDPIWKGYIGILQGKFNRESTRSLSSVAKFTVLVAQRSQKETAMKALHKKDPQTDIFGFPILEASFIVYF